ncbi:hypothetical protein OKW37_000086 [Paraburkholderia sp. MM5482-R2]
MRKLNFSGPTNSPAVSKLKSMDELFSGRHFNRDVVTVRALVPATRTGPVHPG